VNRLPILALTPGEPAGIGPDLAVTLANAPDDHHLVLIADPRLLRERAAQRGLVFDPLVWTGQAADNAQCYVLPVALQAPVTAGRLNPANAGYVLATLERAVSGCLAGEFDALVTGPVHKGVINDAGIAFTGHTEFLAQRANARQVVMLLVAGELRVGRSRHPASRDTCASLRVALATTHLPLAQVPQAITRDHLRAVIITLHNELRAKLGIHTPRILVCGLNPHAGEGGHLGREEIDVIEPVLAELRAAGMNLRGPVPADTAFTPAQLADADVVLAMFHDQGLPVLKAHGFGEAVNITLGLPFIRTSVDHGTALERAGNGPIDHGSLHAALDAALAMVPVGSQTSALR